MAISWTRIFQIASNVSTRVWSEVSLSQALRSQGIVTMASKIAGVGDYLGFKMWHANLRPIIRPRAETLGSYTA